MTQEQYNKAVEINKRLEELNEVKKRIGDTSMSFLSYCDREYRPRPELRMKFIADNLYRHDKMIRAEIDEEIEKLKKEIEEL